MSLFTVILQFSQQDRAALARLVVAAERQATAEERQAVAFEALITKLNEDDVPEAVTVDWKLGPVREQPNPS